MARRLNGEGSFREREGGTWEARFTYEDAETGAVKRASVYGKSREEVRRKMRERTARAAAGQPLKDSEVTVAEFAEQWIGSTLAASDRKPSTREVYAIRVRGYISPGALGATPLARLRPHHVERLVLDMREAGRSDSTIRQTYGVLRLILDGAVRDGLLARNVAVAVKRPRVSQTEAHFLTGDEVARLVIAAWRPRSRYGALIELLALTGLRRGEALALRWQDVDLDGRTLRVRGTLSRAGGGALTITETKTERSRRVLPLPDRAVTLLRAHRAAQEGERAALGPAWPESDLVFTSRSGAPVEPRNALRAVVEAAQAAGLDGVKVHSLRHSAAATMLAGGASLKAVADHLGHASVATTGNTYAHVAPEVARAGADLLGAALAGVSVRPYPNSYPNAVTATDSD